MSVRTSSSTSSITEPPKTDESDIEYLKTLAAAPRKYEIIYFAVLYFIYIHLAALYGLYLACTVASWKTLLFNYVIYVAASIGLTAGAHRLWSHRAFKAKLPLQILLAAMNSFAYQYSAIEWAREHRLHHKHSDTDADPYNAGRGLFYSHMGWFVVKHHEEVARRIKHVDMTDLYANPVLTFQRKHMIEIGIICFFTTTIIPMYFFGETLNTSWHITVLRYVLNIHGISLINSLSHAWGNKPYDKTIRPTQNKMVSIATLGEGFHNFHHAFPWDYRASELGNNILNFSTVFIDFFAWLGWAYDLRTVSEDVVMSRAKRTGDGTNSWGI